MRMVSSLMVRCVQNVTKREWLKTLGSKRMLRKPIYYIWLCQIISGCGMPIHAVERITYEREFANPVNWYADQLNFYCTSSDDLNLRGTIIKHALTLPRIGECINYGDEFIIHIDPIFVKGYSYENVFETVVHELTHCVLRIHEHSPDTKNYMYTSNRRLPLSVLKEQAINDIKTVCKGKR